MGGGMKLNRVKQKELKRLRLLVRTFGNLMYKRLKEKYLKDKFTGWDEVDKYNIIQKMLEKKANEIIQQPLMFDDYIDLCNVAMFRYNNKHQLED